MKGSKKKKNMKSERIGEAKRKRDEMKRKKKRKRRGEKKETSAGHYCEVTAEGSFIIRLRIFVSVGILLAGGSGALLIIEIAKHL